MKRNIGKLIERDQRANVNLAESKGYCKISHVLVPFLPATCRGFRAASSRPAAPASSGTTRRSASPGARDSIFHFFIFSAFSRFIELFPQHNDFRRFGFWKRLHYSTSAQCSKLVQPHFVKFHEWRQMWLQIDFVNSYATLSIICQNSGILKG